MIPDKIDGALRLGATCRDGAPAAAATSLLKPSGLPRRAWGGEHTAVPFVAVDIFDSVAAARQDWDELLCIASTSPYQRRDWIEAWADTEGQEDALTPMIVVARDAGGAPVALLPLGLRRRGWLRIGTFLGGRQTNYHMGLFDPRLAWTGTHADQLLRAAARALPGGIDLFALFNQPEQWNGFANPMAALPGSQPSPSLSHRAVLTPDGEAFLVAHQSGAARKKLRAKAAQLAAIGPVRHVIADTPALIEAVIDAQVKQKAAKLTALGMTPPDAQRVARLLRRATSTLKGGTGPLELHALTCGEVIVATFGGVPHAGHFSGTVISYTMEPAMARCSPGELLLTAVVRAKCAAGYAGFDLGVGEARYKESLCPIADALVDSFLPITTRAHAYALAGTAKQRAKTVIKRSPPLWGMVQIVRKVRGRLRRG